MITVLRLLKCQWMFDEITKCTVLSRLDKMIVSFIFVKIRLKSNNIQQMKQKLK